MTASRWTVAVLMVGLLAGCGSSSAATTGSSPTPSASAIASPVANPGGCPAEKGGHPDGQVDANYATALAFAPDGTLFYAERGGRVMEWFDGKAQVFATVDTMTTEPGGGYSERGLLGLALSPNFPQDHFVYAFYHLTNHTQARVVRWTDCTGHGASPQTVIDNLPAGSDCCHKGGRIAFGPDGMLYVTMGENHVAAAPRTSATCGARSCATSPMAARL